MVKEHLAFTKIAEMTFFRIRAPQNFSNQCAGYRRKNATHGQLRNYSVLIEAPYQHSIMCNSLLKLKVNT